MSKISVGSKVIVGFELDDDGNLEDGVVGTVLKARELSGGMLQYLVDVNGLELYWYDFQVRAIDDDEPEQQECEINSIKFTFSDLKIHFG